MRSACGKDKEGLGGMTGGQAAALDLPVLYVQLVVCAIPEGLGELALQTTCTLEIPALFPKA